ncbi:DUF2334 domain-containing protein [Ramlibacter sp. G-1-2-2]|uniref:DUF2334 domain-containing protein n=2 Tax=Ramlibacter agri TaxID=2728837 RepID=A0A848HCL1_9BURK|nr:DUF2334 domain-containing protein [Ramlibacter agri]
MLRNLLGHFDAAVDVLPVQEYQAGQVDAHAATFYLGSDYNAALPATFLHDAAATAKTLVWFKYNLWELANDASLGFGASHGIAFDRLRGMNAVPSAANPQPGFFDQVVYKKLSFVKYYNYDAAANRLNADPDIGVVTIADPAKAKELVPIYDTATGEEAPYIVRAGTFWYVADVPFSFIGPRDRYLVIADLLHDMLGINHAESHRAMVRLEDVDAKVSVQTMKKLTDLMEGKGIPFSMALIPHYKDPLGYANGGVPQDIPLAQATDLKTAANYATAHGGQVVMHGYTHQYGAQQNPWTGVSGDDYEFWDIVNNKPVAEDSQLWAYGRLQAGLAELAAANLRPIAWETPHYQASANTSKVVPLAFDTTYQRVVYYTADQPDFSPHAGKDFTAGQLFPYVIQRDWYNQRVLPENLGNIEYDIRKVDPMSFYNYTWQDIALNAQYAWVVRDGFASFFFHPFWAEKDMDTPGYEDFKSLLDAIGAQGYTWVAPGSLK